jgi:hypothetical protein
MSIKATEGLAPEWYTPPGQDDDPNPARFHIKPLNGAEFGEVADYLEITPAGALIRHAGRERALALGLIGWEGFTDRTGKAMPFSTANAKLIPHEIRTHIVARIINISYMGEDAEKN